MAKPIEYHLEIYEESFINDPLWSAEASTPFPSVSVGDRFEQRSLAEQSWHSSPSENQEFRVKDVEHIFWELEKSVGHKLMIKLHLVEKTQEF